MLLMTSQGAGQTEQSFVIATQAFVVELTVAMQKHCLFYAFQAFFLRVGGKPKEVADEICDL